MLSDHMRSEEHNQVNAEAAPEKGRPSKLHAKLLEMVKDQAERYAHKVAWRLYTAFYDEATTIDIIGRNKTVPAALRAVSRELHRAERIWRDGYEQGRLDALTPPPPPPEPPKPRPRYKHQ